MNILGIGGYSHDSAAALVCDGQLVAAVAEERLTRRKHQGGVPRNAVAWCLETAGLTPCDISHIGCYMRPGLRMARRWAYRLGQMIRSPLYSAGYMGYEAFHNAMYIHGMQGLRGRATRLHFMEHHPAHAAGAFLASPFDRAALLSIDYVGEFAATWMGIGEGTRIRKLECRDYPHSLGVFYSAITDYLGFLRASDEYKVMGLASYGEPEYLDEFRRIVRVHADGQYRLDLSWFCCHYRPGPQSGYFSRKFLDRFGPPRRKGEPVEKRHRNLAASAQKILEEAALALANRLRRATGLRHLCLSGGVALNCSMNGRLRRESPFEDIFIQPASGDDGIAIGAALQLHHRLTGAPRAFVLRDARLGPSFSDGEIRAFLDRAKLSYETPPDLESRVADLLAEGHIVGWFQDRAEFGPRALGARSILADPTRPEMKDLLNTCVKHREEFRPFAPSCLEERASEFFTGCTSSPFMLFVYPVEPAQRGRLPAITHVDGTARVQTVAKDVQPRYYRLIEAFEKRRGVPMVLNTSFNVMGEPIVNTPADAVRCFYSTGMDALALGNHVLVKR
ncbi:MAG TPA: carbamoyltransferase C-terminal domain-containing protein [Candidatus Hydrogenedentes bacterium]|nr:carbamoyltransferase C-terminal domain-containing protein [Candidatus Hydrogenedentota bacterium]